MAVVSINLNSIPQTTLNFPVFPIREGSTFLIIVACLFSAKVGPSISVGLIFLLTLPNLEGELMAPVIHHFPTNFAFSLTLISEEFSFQATGKNSKRW